MTDDQSRLPHPDPDAAGSGAEPGEAQLRKVLAMTNDLEPPRDDLFAQRALQRGRARTARRRNALLGAAAAVVVVALTGGGWAALRSVDRSVGTSAGSAASAPKDSAQEGTAGSSGGTAGVAGPSAPSARDTSPFFGAVTSPATSAFEAVSLSVLDRWRDVFAGAYADDPAATRIVVTVTRHEPELESYVRGAMPPGSVRFAVVRYPWVTKEQMAARVREDAQAWAADGVRILAVGIDPRSDRVVVTADEGDRSGRIVQRYGPIVQVVRATAVPTLPDGSTLPTLQR